MDQTLPPPAKVAKLCQAGNAGSVGGAGWGMERNLHRDPLEAIPSLGPDSHESAAGQTSPLPANVGMHSQVGDAGSELERDLKKIIDEDLSEGLGR